MEVNCNIIKDLLPLYADDLASEDTRALVSSHVDCCESCKTALRELQGESELFQKKGVPGIKRVANEIRRTKRWTVTTAVLLVFSIIISLLVFLVYPVWATPKEAIKSVECMDDGTLKINFTKASSGIISTESEGNTSILCKMSRWKALFPRKLPEGMNDASYGHYTIVNNSVVDGNCVYAKDTKLWYISYWDGTAQTLLWGTGEANSQIPILRLSSSLLWIFLCVLAVFAVTALLGFFIRKRSEGKSFQDTAAIFGSFCLASLIVTSGRFMVYEEFWMTFSTILILTVLISATVLCSFHLYRIKERLGV